MLYTSRMMKWALCSLLLCLAAVPATAQLEDQLSAYTGANATGYLQPLADAFGATLNDGFFRSAYIPESGFHLSLEVRAMGVIFGDDDKVFSATTESGFQPETIIDVPTVVGSGDATIVDGDGGTHFSFPGGFDLNSFGLAVPQLRISAARGTEAVIRYISVSTGDSELGEVSLFGLGLRHSLSQYRDEALPLDVAMGFMWQTFSLGENDAGDKLISASAFTVGLQASKRFPKGIATFEPYVGLGINTFAMDVQYESTGSEPLSIDLDFDRSSTLDLTIGAAFNLHVVNFHGEYSIAGQKSFSFGVAVGNLMY